ncbi:MAG: serine dehydratase subunit alpha family protein [Clostridiales bacterium]|nr:serine dehydratase subunit alpha family protein [Clostridiales bacterium]
MKNTDRKYQAYLNILKLELVPALGCTEPIALAYCAAKARAVLGAIPDRVEVEASGNIIKNVKSVIVPHTGGKKGIAAAAGIGIIAGNADGALEVLIGTTKEQTESLDGYLASTDIKISPLESDDVLDMIIRVYKGKDYASVRIAGKHTNIVHIERNGETVFDKKCVRDKKSEDYALLTLNDIFDFVSTVDIADVEALLQKQIDCNTALSDEGLKNDYGANIGKVLLDAYGNDIHNRAKAKAAAGSDARMNGCTLPVMINSGSGNQGMTVSLPVIEYAKELGSSKEKLFRALTLSNLLSIYIKTGIGTLSAYCGAVSAGAAAGAAIAYLHGADFDTVGHTVVNALAITSGIICDGAKASCAAKIAAAVDAGILGYEMYKRGQKFCSGDGIVGDDIEKTIRNVGILGKEGMRETDKKILYIMTCVD